MHIGSMRAAVRGGLATIAMLCGVAAASAETPETVIVGATLIDGTGGKPIRNSAIHVRDGKIAKVEKRSAKPYPANVRVIDATGKFIVPGMTDAHSHIDSLSIMPMTDAQKRLSREYYPRAFLYNGVTTILNMSSHVLDDVLALKARAENEPDALIPRIYTGASHFTAGGGWGARHKPGVESMEEIRTRITDYKARGFDLVKIIDEEGLGQTGIFNKIRLDQMQEVAARSREAGLPVFVHASDESEYLEAISIRPRAMAHGLFTPQKPDGAVIRGLKANGVHVVPTAVLFEAFYRYRDNPELLKDPHLAASVPDFILKGVNDPALVKAGFDNMDGILRMPSSDWARRAVPDLLKNIKLFNDAGIIMATGTDGGGAVVHSFQAYNLPREAELLANCCMTKMQAIQAATRNAARIIGHEDVFGTIQPGRSADLLILNIDPLRDMKALRDFDRLMVRGQLLDREALSYQSFAREKGLQ